jgi:omega-amidase
MQLAVVQMEIVDEQPSINRQVLANQLDSHPGADLYLLPELWTCGYVQSQWALLATQDSPTSLSWMSYEARRRGIWLGGSIIVADQIGNLTNRFVLFNRDGDLVCEYDKSHLFRPLLEDVYLQAGKRSPPIIQVEGLLMSPAICYDLRFPEMFRRLALKGVDVFLVSSEWPFPRQHALNILVQSRAIENQAFVLLSNRVGSDTMGNDFCGGSGIFSPFGAIIEAGITSTVVSADINLHQLQNLRAEFPVMSHRINGIDYD